MPWRWVLAVALVPSLDAVLRLGRLHPDEVFQTLEPAMRHAFGFGLVADEWKTGLRNWFVPGLFGFILKAAHALTIDDPIARRAILEVPQFALNVAMVCSVYRFAERRIGHARARWSLLLLLAWGPWVWFSGRTMSESFSVAFLVCALERLDDPSLTSRGALAAGVLLGFAEVTRYGSAAMILPALVFVAAQRRWAVLRMTMLGGTAVAIFLGALDRLTWGHWFHSLIEYLKFNLIAGGAAGFGRLPLYWYLTKLWVAPLAIAMIAALVWRSEKRLRSWLFVAVTLTYFVAISVTEHKELRFLYPGMVLSLVAAAPAFVEWMATRIAAGTLVLVFTLALYAIPTPLDVESGDLFHATVAASRAAKTGVLITGETTWGSAGSFYLGRDLTWRACGPECFGDVTFDRAVSVDEQLSPALIEAGFREQRRIGNAVLFARESGP